MGKPITAGTDEWKAVEKIVVFLAELGLTEQAENVDKYLREGNLNIGGFLIQLFGIDGFTPFPDTGSGTTIYIHPEHWPQGLPEWNFDNPRTGEYVRMVILLKTLLHEKFHAEEQGWSKRIWYIPDTLLFFLRWFGVAYNPMETEAYTYTVSTLDKLIDKKIESAIGIAITLAGQPQHIPNLQRLTDEIRVLIQIKLSEARVYNGMYRPNIPIDKLDEAKRKIDTIFPRVPQLFNSQGYFQEIQDLKSLLDGFEADMANM